MKTEITRTDKGSVYINRGEGKANRNENPVNISLYSQPQVGTLTISILGTPYVYTEKYEDVTINGTQVTAENAGELIKDINASNQGGEGGGSETNTITVTKILTASDNTLEASMDGIKFQLLSSLTSATASSYVYISTVEDESRSVLINKTINFGTGTQTIQDSGIIITASQASYPLLSSFPSTTAGTKGICEATIFDLTNSRIYKLYVVAPTGPIYNQATVLISVTRVA